MRLSRRDDSFSSDDEVPLKLVSKCLENSYRTLCEPSINHCEFCDRVFSNKYKSLIHNATHIIIPLLNQKVIKCIECSFYFTTEVEYENHLKKHIKNNGDMKHRIYNDMNNLNLLNDLKSQVNVELENLQVENLIIDISDDDSIANNVCINGTEIDLDMKENGTGENKSVHFDELNIPKVVTCRHCKQKYPNRYSLILHQTSHINFNRRLPPFCAACDWYIAGNKNDLNRHKRSHSPNTRQKIFTSIEKCLQCGLSYRSYINHFKNYHSTSDEKYDKITRVCDLCYQFLKSRKNRSYIKIRTISKVGKRFKCGHCTRKFFELNEVQKTEFIHKWSIKRTIRKITNNQRLKNIQYRLKKINNLNKF